MLRTIFWIGWLFLYLAGRLPSYWRAKRIGKKEGVQKQREFARPVAQKWARLFLEKLKITVAVQGAENLPQPGQTVVFASNHQSFLDIPILLANLDDAHALLARKEIGKIPLLRGWMDMLGCIYVDREDNRSAMTALKEADKLLQSGNSLVVFPEGTRAKGDEIGEFKAGAMRMALKAEVNIVPVVIDGANKLLEAGGWRLKKGNVNLSILPQVPTRGLTRPQQKELPKQLEEMVRAAKQRTAGQAAAKTE